MRLNEKEIDLFKKLSNTGIGNSFIDYCHRLQEELFNPITLTTENLDGRKESSLILQEIINRIKYAGEDKKTGDPNEYV